MSASAPEDAARLAELLLACAPGPAGTRVLAIDGRSGSGKSTLAAAVSERTGAPVVSVEQLYGGWDGLRAGIERLVRDVLAPLAAGERVAVPRYDWTSAEWVEPEQLGAREILIVEGVGAGARDAAPYLSVLAWIEAAETVRLGRASARDREIYEGRWEQWRAQEDDYIRSDRTPERAQIVLRAAGFG